MWQIFQKSYQLPHDFIVPQDIVKNYETGKKLPIPTTISEDFWFRIFLQCFDLHPTARPSFEDLYQRLLVFHEDPDM
uniref:Serine-threonine/tyrosine-protein kinase catalytic domain-containing protein n=1 Tax=Panagrolaimus sp. PS1159 TaxID=55785 RepID=A0AC35F7F4_9BILA